MERFEDQYEEVHRCNIYIIYKIFQKQSDGEMSS